jgi:tetratricopeptide (TPR) repeat protein
VDSNQCKRCGAALKNGECLPCGTRPSFRAAHRDVILILLLSAIAIAGIMFTRLVAAQDKRTEDRIGEVWYDQGEHELAAHQYDAAIESFRKARARDRDKREYVLALATALESANHNDEARQALLHIRESAPENAEINLSLARLAAKRQDVVETLRYYHNALYGLWTGSGVDQQRRDVRIELVNFLLAHDQRSRALSELLVLDTELPDDPAAYEHAGEMFLAAGDPSHALKDFARVLHLRRNDPKALAGAGRAAFETQDYVLARRYLQAANAVHPHSSATGQLLDVVSSVFSRDPLLPRISRDERLRRVTEDYSHILDTLQSCLSAPRNTQNANATLDSLQAEALAFRDRLQPKNVTQDPEVIRDAMDLIYRIEYAVDADCAPVQGLDKALLLIGRKHMGALQ